MLIQKSAEQRENLGQSMICIELKKPSSLAVYFSQKIVNKKSFVFLWLTFLPTFAKPEFYYLNGYLSRSLLLLLALP